MCGRYLFFGIEDTQEIKNILSELSRKYSSDAISNIKKGEIYPTYNMPVLINEGNNKSYEIFKWGFKNFRSNGVIINAKSETLDERKMFKQLINTKRCLIPATGFFEWNHIDGSKDKFLIKPSNMDMFFMAGLYNTFNINGEYITCYVIITTEANDEMSKIHNRMPVILKKDVEDVWLYDLSADIKKILIPYEDHLLIQKVG